MWHTPPRHGRRVEEGEQIAQRAPPIGVQPAPAPMLGRVMNHMAPLAERGQVARRIIGRIMVQMRARDIDPRDANDRRDPSAGRAHPASASITPLSAIGVPPAAIAQVKHAPPMRTPAMLAAPLGTAEADQPRQLGPVDRVEPAMFGHDRHDDSMSQPGGERKQKVTSRTTRSSRRCARQMPCGDPHRASSTARAARERCQGNAKGAALSFPNDNRPPV